MFYSRRGLLRSGDRIDRDDIRTFSEISSLLILLASPLKRRGLSVLSWETKDSTNVPFVYENSVYQDDESP